MPRRGKQQDRLNRSHLLGGVLVEIFYAPSISLCRSAALLVRHRWRIIR
jgi:hypothetical protein